jgi:glutaredoxin
MSEITNATGHVEPSTRERLRSGLGSVLLFLGIAVLSLLVADRVFGLPVSLPRSWYTDRSLWVVIGLLAFGTGWYLLGDSEPAFEETVRAGRPARVGVRFDRVVLYTRPGCHLCDLARETLDKYEESLPSPIEVDIDSEPSLRSRFSTCIPVIEIDGKIRFRGRVNEVLLRRLIEATLPKTAV